MCSDPARIEVIEKFNSLPYQVINYRFTVLNFVACRHFSIGKMPCRVTLFRQTSNFLSYSHAHISPLLSPYHMLPTYLGKISVIRIRLWNVSQYIDILASMILNHEKYSYCYDLKQWILDIILSTSARNLWIRLVNFGRISCKINIQRAMHNLSV